MKKNYPNKLLWILIGLETGEHDTENIRFSSDGTFAYSCSCGNPINDSDLCESYTFDPKTSEIHLEYFETTDETINKIRIGKITNTTLELDFNGEIRIFEKEKQLHWFGVILIEIHL